MMLTYEGQKDLAYGLIKVSGIEIPGCGCLMSGNLRFPSDVVKDLEQAQDGFEVVAKVAQQMIQTSFIRLVICPSCGKPVGRGNSCS